MKRTLLSHSVFILGISLSLIAPFKIISTIMAPLSYHSSNLSLIALETMLLLVQIALFKLTRF